MQRLYIILLHLWHSKKYKKLLYDKRTITKP